MLTQQTLSSFASVKLAPVPRFPATVPSLAAACQRVAHARGTCGVAALVHGLDEAKMWVLRSEEGGRMEGEMKFDQR